MDGNENPDTNSGAEQAGSPSEQPMVVGSDVNGAIEQATPNDLASAEPVEQPIAPAMPEQAPMQPAPEQTPMQPISEQPTAQPMPEQSLAQPMPGQVLVGSPAIQPVGQSAINTPTTIDEVGGTAKRKKQKTLIIGIVVGVIAVAAIIAVLLIILLGGGSKTVACNMSSNDGVNIVSSGTFKVGNGKILSAEMVMDADLKTMDEDSRSFEGMFVGLTESSVKVLCEEYNCTFDSDYVEGEHLRITAEFKEGTKYALPADYEIADKSAQEIADQLQKELEKTEGTVCRQY